MTQKWSRDALREMARRLLRANPDLTQALGVELDEMGDLAEVEVAKRDHIIDRYPWSPYLQHELLMLGRGDIDTAVSSTWAYMLTEARRRGVIDEERLANPMTAEVTQRMMYAISRWIRSDRVLINVSQEAGKILQRVYDERIEAGLTPARWRDLPGPGSSLYGKGVMFMWEGRGAMTFACPYGLFLHEHMEFVEWKHKRYEDGGIGWGARVRYPFTVSRQWCDRDEEQVVKTLREEVPEDADFTAEDITVENYRRLGGHRSHFGALMDTVNALAAMNSGVELVCTRTASGKSERKKRSRTIGGIKGVRPLQLDPSGMYTWSKKYVTLPSDGPGGHGGEREEYDMNDVEYPDDRQPPCLHHVDQHKMTLWVREPKADEEIFDMKEGKGGVVLYAVKRIRGTEDGYMRGAGVKPQRQRLKVGVDDLNIPGD